MEVRCYCNLGTGCSGRLCLSRVGCGRELEGGRAACLELWPEPIACAPQLPPGLKILPPFLLETRRACFDRATAGCEQGDAAQSRLAFHLPTLLPQRPLQLPPKPQYQLPSPPARSSSGYWSFVLPMLIV